MRETSQEKSSLEDGKNVISWRARETNSREKSADWYFILWTVALAGAATATILDNVLFGLLLIISAFTITIYGSRKPKVLLFTVNRKGVTAGSLFIPFSTLSHFAVSESYGPTYLLLQSKKVLAPLYSFPVADEVDIEDLRELLDRHLEEGELEVPFYQQLMDRIGF